MWEGQNRIRTEHTWGGQGEKRTGERISIDCLKNQRPEYQKVNILFKLALVWQVPGDLLHKLTLVYLCTLALFALFEPVTLPVECAF